MIVATVGTQLPFPRLLQALERIAEAAGAKILAQTADPEYSSAKIEAVPFLSPTELDAAVQRADLIIAHAGIGSILTARKFSKPLVLFPRSAALGEHRNNHQYATVSQLKGEQGIYVAKTEEELFGFVSNMSQLAPYSLKNGQGLLQFESALQVLLKNLVLR